VPEYEDCKKIAKKYQTPLRDMMKQIDAEISLKQSPKGKR
jgi:uncharacterized protein (DUF111 family)